MYSRWDGPRAPYASSRYCMICRAVKLSLRCILMAVASSLLIFDNRTQLEFLNILMQKPYSLCYVLTFNPRKYG